MNLDIIRTKHMIHKIYRQNISRYRLGLFTNFSPCYLTTNENLNGYFQDLKFESDNKVLSVLASGDQLFSVISKGAINIDTFDTNSLAEYYVFGIKKALLLKYDYEDFIKIFNLMIKRNLSQSEFANLLNDLLPCMEEKYANFWRQILNYSLEMPQNKKSQNLLCNIAKEPPVLKVEHIPYLESKESYDRLKTNMSKAKITYTNLNAFKMHQKIAKRDYYDCVVLSNILDYAYWQYADDWSYQRLKTYEEQIMPLLKENGVIFLNYVFGYEPDEPLISHSNIKEKHLENESLNTFEGSGIRGTEDAVLLCRKKHKSIDEIAKKL